MEVEKSVFFRCTDCSRVFEKRMHYNRHRKTHERPYPCPLCSKAFGLRTDRERHKATHGRVEVKFKCTFPGCVFRGTSRKDYLWRHMQQKHQSEDDTSAEKKMRAYYEEATREVKVTNENQRDFDLLEAAREGDDNRIRELLSQSSNASRANSSGGTTSHSRTLLHLAAKAGYESLARILIEDGADINDKSSTGDTPFFTAIKAGHENIVKLLLQNGEDVHAISNKSTGISALSMAVKYRHKAVVNLLLEHGAIHEPCAKRTNALFVAVETNQEDLVVLLLKRGAEVNRKNQLSGSTALHEATRISPAMTKLIVDANGDLEGENTMGQTPLFYALDCNSFRLNETTRALIDAGATLTAWEISYLQCISITTFDEVPIIGEITRSPSPATSTFISADTYIETGSEQDDEMEEE